MRRRRSEKQKGAKGAHEICKPRITKGILSFTATTCNKAHPTPPTNTTSHHLTSSSPNIIFCSEFPILYFLNGHLQKNTVSPSNKAVLVLGLFSLLLLLQKASSYEFKVGGSGDWSVPSDHNAVYNQWASRSRFQVGDTLLFTYPANKDSVLQVTKDNFDNCNTKSPLASFSDGHTVYKIKESGPHYFISGVEDHCKNNEKVVIVVMADHPSPPPPNGASSIVISSICLIGAFVGSVFVLVF